MAWFFFSLISALSVTGETLVEKGVVRHHNPALFASVAGVLGGLLTVPFIFIVHWNHMSAFVYLWLCLCGTVTGLAFFASIRSLRHIQVSISAPLFTLTPLIGTLLGVVALSEYLRSGQYIGMALLVVGSYILQVDKGKSWLYPVQRIMQNRGYFYLFMSILLYPLGALMARFSFVHMGVQPYDYFIVTRLYIGLMFAAYLALWGGGLRQVSSQVGKYRGAYFWTIFFGSINSITIILALASSYIAQALAVKRLSALFTTVIGGGMYHEDHLARKTTACLIMLAGALAVALL